MKRRIVVILGTFAILFAVYVVYDLASRSGAPGPHRIRGTPPDLSERSTTLPGVGDVTPARLGHVVILDHDPRDHRLRAKYTVDRWEKLGELVHVANPRAEWYLLTGETVHIQARRGVIRAADLGGSRWKVLGGHLEEDVSVVLDRNRDPRVQRDKPLEQRYEDAVRMHLEEADFDQDRLTVESQGPVKLFSREADLLGRGLFVGWSEAGQGELRQFRIDQGQWMCLRQGQDRVFREMWLPGGRGAGEISSAAEEPLIVTWHGPLVVRPLAGPGRQVDKRLDVSAVGARMELADDATKAICGGFDFWSPSQRGVLRGSPARPVRLEMADGSWISVPEVQFGLGAEAPAGAGGPTGVPASQPGLTALTATAPATSTRPAARQLASQPAGGAVVPDTYLARFSDDVRVSYGSRQLQGADALDLVFLFKRAELESYGQDEPERRSPTTRPSAARPEDEEPPQPELVRMNGPGSMHLPAEAGAEMARASGGEAVDIDWKRSVVVSLGRQVAVTPTGKTERDYLRQAVFLGSARVRQGASRKLAARQLTVTFHAPRTAADPVNRVASLLALGDVEFIQAPRAGAATGDYVRSDELEVMMSGGDERSSYPRWAMAKGNVSARQGQADLTAGALTVTFAPVTDPKTHKVEILPRRLDASEGVEIVDRSGSRTVTAKAETLTSDLVSRQATLTGRPARVEREDWLVEGAKIFVDEEADDASVDGAGKLRFYTDQDLSGNKTARPMPVEITWKNELRYDGRNALIKGKVVLKTVADPKAGGDMLACDDLHVLFEPPEKPTETAAETRPARPGQLDLPQKKIAMIVAEGAVKFQSTRQDDDGFLLSRITLWSEKMIYHTLAGVINCPVPGRLQLEDYRKPKEGSRGPAALMAAGEVSRPSQTNFRWGESMNITEVNDQFVVAMSRKVRMFHRTGRELLLKDRLDVRPWGALLAGRNTILDCGNLLARFAPAEEQATTRPAAPTGPRLGRLELFEADTDVNLRDTAERVEIGCHRILYKWFGPVEPGRPGDVVKIMGTRAKNAVASYWSQKTGRHTVLQAPLIIWHPDTNEFKTVKAEVVGGG